MNSETQSLSQSVFTDETKLAINLRGKPNIAYQLLGIQDISFTSIRDYDDFLSIFKIRHDLIHSLICSSRSLTFGERKVSEVLGGRELKEMSYWDLVKNQTPDYMGITGPLVHILELSVSRSRNMKREKYSKYALLSFFLKQNGFKVHMEVVVINPDSVYQQRESLIQENLLNDPCIDMIKKICDNCRTLESQVKSTPEGSLYYLQYHDVIEGQMDLGVSIQDIINIHRSQDNKTFHTEEDLISTITSEETTYINSKDKAFLSHCLSFVDEIRPTLTSQETFDESKFIGRMVESSVEDQGFENLELRSIFPLPYMSMKSVDSSIRSTEDDLILTNSIASSMTRSGDPVLATFGDGFLRKNKSISQNSDFPFEVSMSREMKSHIALEGPNRKHYAKRPDLYPEHHLKQREHTRYNLSYHADVSEVLNLSLLFSDKETPRDHQNIMEDSVSLSNLRGIGLDYVRVCQSVFREVNINALRSDRRKMHILKPTGVDGVFVLIFKGNKLRTGELVSQIWFKVIIDQEKLSNLSEVRPSWAFKKIIHSVGVSHSHWISTDAHRLDHHIRSYDKILMAYYSFMTMRYRTTYDFSLSELEQSSNKTIIESMREDNSNTLGLIILIYMEDRRSTSKLLQNIRYLVMTMISIFKYPNSVMEKCMEPIRSPLQLFFLKKMIDFIKAMEAHDLSKNYNYGSVKFDEVNKIFMDNKGGARLLLPRPVIHSGYGLADFSEVLSEMYLCMLFNKNQDDPTHASFQILSKMLEGEESMRKMKDQNDHLGYKPSISDEKWAEMVVMSPHAHKFSRRALEIGSKLNREMVGDRLASDIRVAASKPSMDKTIDEFATYKSSSVIENLEFRPNEIKQNKRRKCVENAMDLLKEGHMRSSDVAKAFLNEPVEFQIFKKNQIGGVREILILTLRSRIKINIIETLSRNICQFDKRETLTHGDKKNEIIRELLFEARKKEGRRMSLFFSFDKSRWGPSFVPIQFIYLFTPFKKELGNMFYYVVSQLILHQNKKCLLPDRLIRAWALDEDNNFQHRRDKNLQKLKMKFIRDKLLYFVNESNMGQGILHYTSSLLHACMISFRDELYRMKCDQLGLDSDDHSDLFSSDDSFTIMSIEIYKITTLLKKIDVFMRCQEVSERLFNCWTSKSKSSINPLIGEFNSLFMSNLTFYPTLIKFAVASVHPVNTDSFFRMVKESYASSRQIFENGGTLDLYMVSHQMNKRFCESIYHTNNGGQNDLRQINVVRKPYQVGEYPIFNPSLMMMFGPEFHNYMLYKEYNIMNSVEKRLFMNSHKVLKGGLVETMAEMEDGDTMLGGLLRIEAKIGPIRQLERIKRESIMTREEIQKMILDDPLLLLRKPKTLEEVIFKTCHKLFIPGAKEAVKTICSSIYYGRVSASVSAKAFYIPNSTIETKTYMECLHQLIDVESEVTNLDNHIKFLYPKWPEYELFVNEGFSPIVQTTRNVLEVQTTRALSIFKIGTKLSNSLSDILSYMWEGKDIPDFSENRYLRDIQIIKNFYPLLKDSMQETISQFSGDHEDKMKGLIMLIMKLFSLRDRQIKAIMFGGSTIDVRSTYFEITEKNIHMSMTHEIPFINSEKPFLRRTYNSVYARYNYYILSEVSGQHHLSERVWDDVSEEEVNLLLMDKSVSRAIKKRLFMPLLSHDKISEIESWTDKTSVILHYWENRQRQTHEGKWVGDMDLILFMGKKKMRVIYIERINMYKLYKTDFEEPQLLFEFLSEILDILNVKEEDLLRLVPPGDWIVRDDKILHAPKSGFLIENIIFNTPPVFSETMMDVSESMTTITDKIGKKLFSIPTGLIPCTLEDLDLPDFQSFGMSFMKMLKNNVFTKSFDLATKPRKFIRELLDDLNVVKPKVSNNTKEKLGLSDNWDTKNDTDPLEIELQEESESNPINFFLSVSDEELKTLKIDWDYDPLFSFIDEFKATDFFNTTTTRTEISFPKQILNNVMNLKYDCISMLCTDVGLVNSSIIKRINSLLGNNRQNVVYSLISRYDRFVSGQSIQSPDQVVMSLDNHLERLGLMYVEGTPID